MEPQLALLLILMALVAPWVKTLMRELFVLFRSLSLEETTKDQFPLKRVSATRGPGDQRSLSEGHN